MRRLCFFALWVMMICGFAACDSNSIDGNGQATNFSPSTIMFHAKGGTQVIKNSNNVQWWFDALNIDGVPVDLNKYQLTYAEGKEHNIQNVTGIRGDWFSIKRTATQEIEIQVDSAAKATRVLRFDAFSGDPTQTITVVQTAN